MIQPCMSTCDSFKMKKGPKWEEGMFWLPWDGLQCWGLGLEAQKWGKWALLLLDITEQPEEKFIQQSAEASSDAGRNTGRRTSFSGISCHSCCNSTNRCEVFLHVWKGRRARKGKEHWQEGAVVAQKPISCLTAETHRIHCPHLNRKAVFINWLVQHHLRVLTTLSTYYS